MLCSQATRLAVVLTSLNVEEAERALDKVAKDKGYTLVWSNGVNAVFIRDDRVSNKSDFAFERLFVPFTPHAPDPKNRPWVTI